MLTSGWPKAEEPDFVMQVQSEVLLLLDIDSVLCSNPDIQFMHLDTGTCSNPDNPVVYR